MKSPTPAFTGVRIAAGAIALPIPRPRMAGNASEPSGYAPARQHSGLTAVQLAICRNMGLDPVEFARDLHAETAAARQAASLTASQLAICRNMGLDPVEFARARAD